MPKRRQASALALSAIGRIRRSTTIAVASDGWNAASRDASTRRIRTRQPATDGAADQREHDRFGEQYAHDAHPRRPECPAHGQLLLARDAARHQHAGDVEARDEQHQHRGTERPGIHGHRTRPCVRLDGNRVPDPLTPAARQSRQLRLRRRPLHAVASRSSQTFTIDGMLRFARSAEPEIRADAYERVVELGGITPTTARSTPSTTSVAVVNRPSGNRRRQERLTENDHRRAGEIRGVEGPSLGRWHRERREESGRAVARHDRSGVGTRADDGVLVGVGADGRKRRGFRERRIELTERDARPLDAK